VVRVYISDPTAAGYYLHDTALRQHGNPTRVTAVDIMWLDLSYYLAMQVTGAQRCSLPTHRPPRPLQMRDQRSRPAVPQELDRRATRYESHRLGDPVLSAVVDAYHQLTTIWPPSSGAAWWLLPPW